MMLEINEILVQVEYVFLTGSICQNLKEDLFVGVYEVFFFLF